MTYLHISANSENNMLTSPLAPVTESKTGVTKFTQWQKLSQLGQQTDFVFLQYSIHVKLPCGNICWSGTTSSHRPCDFDYFNQHSETVLNHTIHFTECVYMTSKFKTLLSLSHLSQATWWLTSF